MNTDNNNVTTMHNTVEKYLLDNSAVWNLVKAIADAVKKFTDNNAYIADKRAEQEQVTEGETDLKQTTKGALVDKAFVIAEQLHALAEKNEDVVLAAQTNVTVTGLLALADDSLIEKGEAIEDLADKNKVALVDYNITDADLTELGAAIEAFKKNKNAPAVARSKRSGQTRTIPAAIHANQRLLTGQIDRMMSGFRTKNPTFYAGYHAARVVIDRRAHRKQEPPTPPTPPSTPTPPPA